MDFIDLILSKLSVVGNGTLQYFDRPAAILVLAAIVVLSSLAFVNQRR